MNYVKFVDDETTITPVVPQARRRHFVTLNRFVRFVEILDTALVVAAAYLAHGIRFGNLNLSGIDGMTTIVAALLAWMLFRHTQAHNPEVLGTVLRQMRRAVTALVMVFCAMLAIGYATKTSESISRLWVGIWFLCATSLFLITRFAIARSFRKRQASGTFVQRAAICSSCRDLPRLEQFLERWRDMSPPSHELAGIYLADPEQLGERLPRWQHLIRGSVDDLLHDSERERLHSVLVVIAARGCDNMEPVIQKLRTVCMDVDLLAGDVDPVWANRPVGKVAGLPVMRIMSRPLNDIQILMKRALDIAISLITLLVFSPLMLLVAVAIKLNSPGPVLFRQYRHGFNNRPFKMLKFRTMYDVPAGDGVPQARRNDPRVTRVGSFLRRTSLDELPQIVNVLRGEMSIVGPRPHACEHNDQFAQMIDSYLGRHRIKPGITGWAQVHGFRGETNTLEKMRKRIEYDLHYADNWSITLDLKIMFMTLGCLIHRNAY